MNKYVVVYKYSNRILALNLELSDTLEEVKASLESDYSDVAYDEPHREDRGIEGIVASGTGKEDDDEVYFEVFLRPWSEEE